MHLTKILKNKYLPVGLFILLFFTTRLPSLGVDAINPDGVNWHYRSQQFIVGLKSGDFEKTHQHYHPGVTLMWVAGIPIELIKQLNPEDAVYTHLNFMKFHTAAKLALVLVQFIVSILIIFVLYKVLLLKNRQFPLLMSVFTVGLFSLEPFFLGNSRLLHLDVLLALLLFLGLLLFYLYIGTYKYTYGVFAAIILSLAFLTKSIAIGALSFSLAIGGMLFFKELGFKGTLKLLLPFLVIYIVTLFLFFPAMWTAPVDTIYNIFDEAERVGIRKGHEQIVFGEYTRDAGPLFYILVLLLKTTPFTLIGLVAFLVFKFKSVLLNMNASIEKIKISPELFLGIFYFGYLLVMMYPSKKLDRYMIPLYPFFGFIAVYGYYELYNKLKRVHFVILTLVLSMLFVVCPVLKLHPYPFTYSTPLVGSADSAHKILAQKPFGIGIPALREFIFEKYGEYPTLGFIDTKPMSAIYMNSRLFDIRVDGTSNYDIIVLAVDEEMPQEILESENKFVHDSSYYINGLEYWRIYVKEK